MRTLLLGGIVTAVIYFSAHAAVINAANDQPTIQNGNDTAVVIVSNNLMPNQPPTAVCQDIGIGVSGSTCQAYLNAIFLDGGSSDPEDGTNLTRRINPANPFDIGVHQIWLIVSDSKGLEDSCQSTVFVIDNKPPIATCPGDISVMVGSQTTDTAITWSASVTDNCPGVNIVCTPASGSAFTVGVTEVCCVATDTAGNVNTCCFVVTIIADTAQSSCACDCFADPVCDQTIDIFDVLNAVNVAFQNGPPIVDPLSQCPNETTDVTCDGVTDIFDVLRLFAVASQNADPAVAFCDPCNP